MQYLAIVYIDENSMQKPLLLPWQCFQTEGSSSTQTFTWLAMTLGKCSSMWGREYSLQIHEKKNTHMTMEKE